MFLTFALTRIIFILPIFNFNILCLKNLFDLCNQRRLTYTVSLNDFIKNIFSCVFGDRFVLFFILVTISDTLNNENIMSDLSRNVFLSNNEKYF